MGRVGGEIVLFWKFNEKPIWARFVFSCYFSLPSSPGFCGQDSVSRCRVQGPKYLECPKVSRDTGRLWAPVMPRLQAQPQEDQEGLGSND